MSYKSWVWKKENYDFKKSYRYKNDIKDEIEFEIVKMNNDKRAECSNRLSQRHHVIQTITNPFLKSDYIKDLQGMDFNKRTSFSRLWFFSINVEITLFKLKIALFKFCIFSFSAGD